MSYEIEISPQALIDLQQAKAYISEELGSVKAANNTIGKIIKRIHDLADFPCLGTPLTSIIGYETDYRYLVCNHYIAFYRCENQTVFIVRVIYGRRDYIRVLFDPPEDDTHGGLK